jgi:hypothetical protein
MNTTKFKTIEETVKSIAKLRLVEWPTFDSVHNIELFIKEVECILFSEFDYLPSAIRKNKKFGLPIFRARELSKEFNIDNPIQHSYPPANFVKLGRCNFPKNPVFYGSINPLTALREVIRDNSYSSKTYCITKWSVSSNIEEISSQSILQIPLPPNNQFTMLKDDERNKVKGIFGRNLSDSQVNGIISYWEFLHEIFTSKDSYSLSATLAHKTLYSENAARADILMYPSLQSESVACNFAIHPNFVDNHMNIEWAYIVELLNYEVSTGRFDLSVKQFGRIENNRFIWSLANSKLYDHAYDQDFKYMVQ